MEDDEGGGPAAKKVRTANGKGVAAPKGVKEVTKVYTDGSALGNGKFGASAGVGVYFGENDSRYILLSVSLPSFFHISPHFTLSSSNMRPKGTTH